MPYDPNQPRVPAGGPAGGEFAGVSSAEYQRVSNLMGEGAARAHFERLTKPAKEPTPAQKYRELGTTAHEYNMYLKHNKGDVVKTESMFRVLKQRKDALRPPTKTAEELAHPHD